LTYLAASEWRLGFIMEEWPDIAFRKTREHIWTYLMTRKLPVAVFLSFPNEIDVMSLYCPGGRSLGRMN
jgi:hypothetical protein